MTRLAVRCAVLLAAGWLRADTLQDASNWPDLVYSAKQRGIDYPATVARARHGDVAGLAILFRHTPHTEAPARILIASYCVSYWSRSAIRNSAARFGKSQLHFAAKSQKHSISTSVIRGRSGFRSLLRWAP
jgi:hypothetical protein